MGRLTSDPEVRYTQSQNPTGVARYTLAVRRSYAKEDEPNADFIDIVAFGKRAEFAEKYFKKGQLVAVVGKLKVDHWEDDKKVKRKSVSVVVEEQHFAEGKQYSNNSNEPQHGNKTEGVNIPANYPNISEDEEDLPF